MATSGGQSIQDRLTAARLSLAGQGLAKSVCKATTEEIIGPKKKHLEYLVHCTAEPNVSIPQLANLLIERTQSTSWVVVFKALVSVHHLMCYGNERFTQYLASSNCTFHLHNFIDKANVSGYDMSTFVRRYSKYLNEKALSYRTQAFDFCKVKRGVEGVLRTMHAEKLVKGLPVLQNQMDALLEFDCTTSELTNGIINAAFMLLFRDLIRLFACYNDGIINLLEKYFDMNKKMCREALDIYKKFLIRMDKVAEFLKVAESVGIDKGEIPDLAKAPGSLLEALEQHLASLEGKKTSGAVTPTQPNNKPVSALVLPNSVKSAVIALSSTSNAFGTAASVNVTSETNGFNIEETVKKTILEEEQAALNFHKERRLKELGESPTEGAISSNNPFLSSPGNTIKPIGGENVIDFFGSATGTPATTPAVTSSKASDDLLCLSSNPFTGTVTDGAHHNGRPAFGNNVFWGAQNGVSTPSTTFVSSSNFDAVFGGSSATTGGFNAPPPAIPAFDAFGDILQPQHIGSQTLATPLGSEIPPPATSSQSKSQAKVLSGDLDTSLANLAQNLDINRGGAQVKSGQWTNSWTASQAASFDQKSSQMWNSPRNTSKTGGANWSPQVAPSTTPAGPAWNSPQHLQHAFNTPMAPGPMMVLGYPNQQPFVQAGARPVQSGMPVMGVGMSSGMFPVTQTAPPMVPTGQQSAFDPFGQL